jgi:hypothetical protein
VGQGAQQLAGGAFLEAADAAGFVPCQLAALEHLLQDVQGLGFELAGPDVNAQPLYQGSANRLLMKVTWSRQTRRNQAVKSASAFWDRLPRPSRSPCLDCGRNPSSARARQSRPTAPWHGS